MDPTDIVYYRCGPEVFRPCLMYPVRWLDWEVDFPMVHAYWAAAGSPLARETWLESRDLGYTYAALIEDGAIRSCAAAWNYSAEQAELSAVSTGQGFRHRGYAKSVCSFVTSSILRTGRIATVCTTVDNLPMQHTAESLGYQRIPVKEGLLHQQMMKRHLQRRLAEIKVGKGF